MFCRSAMKVGNVGGLSNRKLFPEFRELRFGGPVIPCGDMHQSFTDTLVKWFFNTFADSLSVLSIYWVAQGLGTRFLYKCLTSHIARWFPVAARPSCLISSLYTIQPVVKPVVKPVVNPVVKPVVSCIQTFSRLSNPFDNRFDNRLYRVYSRLSNRSYNPVWRPVERTVAVCSTWLSNRLYLTTGCIV